MTTGESHPAAELPSLSLPRDYPFPVFYSPSITSSRFAVLVRSWRDDTVATILVWDWRKGKLLLVSESWFYHTLRLG